MYLFLFYIQLFANRTFATGNISLVGYQNCKYGKRRGF